VSDLYKQRSCTGKYGKKINSNTQLGILSICFVLLVDCFLRTRSEIALSAVSKRGLCALPSTLKADAFTFTGWVCSSGVLRCVKYSSR